MWVIVRDSVFKLMNYLQKLSIHVAGSATTHPGRL